MKIKYPNAYYAYLCLFLSSVSFASCDFDTDDADAPDFMDKIIACEEQETASKPKVAKSGNAIKLYGDGTVNPESGISERPIVAAGSMNHSASKLFAARQAYSLRPDAKFEESVTIATQKLYLEMAHHCAKGWAIESQWSEPNPEREGDYFLHYGFRCAALF
jgi:hypothetical protein